LCTIISSPRRTGEKLVHSDNHADNIRWTFSPTALLYESGQKVRFFSECSDMYMYNIKKNGKTITKGWHTRASNLVLELENKWNENAWDEIIIRKPAVSVLPTQAEIEALGQKD